MVLGIVRGGVPASIEVARALALPLDLLVLRGILQRVHGDPVRAARVAGRLLLDDQLKGRGGADSVEDIFIAGALDELSERERTCRRLRPPADVEGRMVILVDNGIRTGTTIRGAVRATRRAGAARVVVAVPVSSSDGLEVARGLADEVVCLAVPEPFGNAAMWYQRFDVPPDEEIAGLAFVPA